MERIFIISKQKCGTTSTAQFLEDHGITVARADGWHNRLWSLLHFAGKHEEIFSSQRFNEFRAYEDEPWWMSNIFDRILSKFPDSKFILLKRNKDEWFDSLKKYLNNRPHYSVIHALEYPRTEEYHMYLSANRRLLRNHSMKIDESHRALYTQYFEDYHDEINAKIKKAGREEQLFTADLSDADKWVRLGEFLNIQVPADYSVHANRASASQSHQENLLQQAYRDIKWVLRECMSKK